MSIKWMGKWMGNWKGPRIGKGAISGITLAAAGLVGALGAASSSATTISNNVPGFIRVATPAGATNPGTKISVMVWLQVRDQAALNQLAANLYNPKSSSYRQWVTPAQFAEQFAPTSANAATVASFLTANGLTITQIGPKNMYVKATGTVANVNKAFQVQLQNFTLNGQTLYANTTAPVVSGAAGALVQAVYGLHNLQYTHPSVTQTTLRTGTGAAVKGIRATGATAPSISSLCVAASETETLKNNGNSYPYAALKGNAYAPDSGTQGGCGYTPPEIQAAYNLTGLYAEGYNGAGQTIVIIDWCGSPTIEADANTFSAAYGLPPLTSSNFQILYSSTTPTCGAPDPEINIDVEWSHAIAPGANIALVVPPSASFQDVDSGEFYAIINGLGGVISGSYGSEEIYDTPAEVQTESLINEIAAVQGIAANFSTGDEGDYTFDEPEYNPPSVSAPADSPYATGIGGISLELKSNNTIAWQAGWGTNITPIDSEGTIEDPPTDFSFFNFGSGGGASAVLAKPSYQASLSGAYRLLPDISWLADPYTGGVIVISEPFQNPEQVYEVYGGTSLACPMFSALWAIANQEAGAPLGQAAPYLYSMPASTITDITPVTSATNVTANFVESATVVDHYTAAQLAGPLENTTEFVSAIWNYPLYQDTVYVLTFGTDSGLTTATGWDNATGVGVPAGKAFADYFKP